MSPNQEYTRLASARRRLPRPQAATAAALYTSEGAEVRLENLYGGHAAFLICSGPSLLEHDLSQLNRPGILTMAVNNAAVVFRPHLWCAVDQPQNFLDAIWYDPGILKFVPVEFMQCRFSIRGPAFQLEESTHMVAELPAVLGFRRNDHFDAERWLHEETFNWGNHAGYRDAYGIKGSRSVMYVAIRLLFYLGIRRLYLLGCDFRMRHDEQNYAFPQRRSAGSVFNNNQSYDALNVRLRHLRPRFEEAGLRVLNCTPRSGLTAFPHLPFEAAVRRATAVIPRRIVTEGMYNQPERQLRGTRS